MMQILCHCLTMLDMLPHVSLCKEMSADYLIWRLTILILAKLTRELSRMTDVCSSMEARSVR